MTTSSPGSNASRLRSLSLLFLLLSALLLTQCRLQPGGVLGADKMKAVTRDLLLLEASRSVRTSESDSLYRLRYQALLADHGVTEAVYDSSLVWYAENAQYLTKIYEELQKEFQAESALLDSAILDSTELYRIKYTPIKTLWTGASRFVISANRRILYRTQPLTGIAPGDTVDFSVRVFPPLSPLRRLSLSVIGKDSSGLVVERHHRELSPGLPARAAFALGGDTARQAARYEFLFRYRSLQDPDSAALSGTNYFVTFDSVVLLKRLPPAGRFPSQADSLKEIIPKKEPAELRTKLAPSTPHANHFQE